ncbi:hypothetical protein C7U60_12150 [Mesorhizobium plurifarium]|uniref:hypothetical protein n=1 Tax=Sinorhizobium arboris TaxID=76745 RepID=UPI0004165720|nr:hypothetical protein [Sinorhizobium arboris]PST22003.1 hypothetical protein C7U60_12150 [Mesorhizobium plurifarium]
MRAETYAVVNLAALNLIEAVSAAYFVTENQAVARHEFRAREMLKKIALALGYELAEAAARESMPGAEAPPAALPGLRLVSAGLAPPNGNR